MGTTQRVITAPYGRPLRFNNSLVSHREPAILIDPYPIRLLVLISI